MLLTFALNGASAQKAISMKPAQGTAFHFCSCQIPCPCMFKSPDVPGCTIVRVYHFTDGGYLGKDLAGLTIVFVPHPEALKKQDDSPKDSGKPLDGRWFISSETTEKQRWNMVAALYELHSDSLGFGQANTIKVKGMKFQKTESGYDIVLPNIMTLHTNAFEQMPGKPVVANNLYLEGGTSWTIGAVTKHTYQDPEQKDWKWSMAKGSNGSWTTFKSYPHVDPSDENTPKKPRKRKPSSRKK